MQATTISAIAGSVSAAVSGISAAIAAFSAYNSRKSAQASVDALRETRQQRDIDNARTDLHTIGVVYDDAMALVEALDAGAYRNPGAVQRARDALRRSTLVGGLALPALARLAKATEPLSSQEVAAVQQEIAAESDRLHQVLGSVPTAHESSLAQPAGGND